MNNKTEQEIMTGHTSDINYSDLKLEGLKLEEINQIGNEYCHGANGRKKDLLMAKKYYLAAAERGFINSQFNLANIYWNAPPQDCERAFYWFRKTADAGDTDGKTRVGLMYNNGEGVKKDIGQAIKWYEEAGKGGCADAWFFLGSLYNDGDGIPQDYKKAFDYFLKAAEGGNTYAQYNLGLSFFEGKHTERNVEQAIKWLEAAGMQGESKAWLTLGNKFHDGDDVSQDYEKSLYYYNKAAEVGDITAQYYLGLSFLNGEGTKQDYDTARVCFESAANIFSWNALKSLDEMYETNKIKNSKYKSAAEWYQACDNNGEAAHQYAYFFQNTDPEDKAFEEKYNKCISWLGIAADKGNIKAFYQLIFVYNYYKSFTESKVIPPSTEKITNWAKTFFPIKKKNQANEKEECELLIRKMGEFFEIFKREGTFGLQGKMEEEQNDLLKTGLGLLVDATDHELVNSILQLIADPNKKSDKIILQGISSIQKGEKPCFSEIQ
jgi:hypothetical protein